MCSTRQTEQDSGATSLQYGQSRCCTSLGTTTLAKTSAVSACTCSNNVLLSTHSELSHQIEHSPNWQLKVYEEGQVLEQGMYLIQAVLDW